MINGSPQVYNRGTLDLSGRKSVPTPIALSSHVAKQYIYAVKGKALPQLMKGADRIAFYGANTFNDKSPYFNHSTYFANIQDSVNANCMYQRIIPTDATESNFTLWLDVAETYIDDYERDYQNGGKIKTDDNSLPLIKSRIPGFKVQFRVSSVKSGTAVTAPAAVSCRDIKKGNVYQIESLSTSNLYPADYSDVGAVDSVNGTVFTAVRGGNATYGNGTVVKLIDYTQLVAGTSYAFLDITDPLSRSKNIDLSVLGATPALASQNTNTYALSSTAAYAPVAATAPTTLKNIRFYEVVDFAANTTLGTKIGLISAPTTVPNAVTEFEDLAGLPAPTVPYKSLSNTVSPAAAEGNVVTVKKVKTTVTPINGNFIAAKLTDSKDIVTAGTYLIFDDTAGKAKLTDYAMLAGIDAAQKPVRGTITSASGIVTTMLNRVGNGFKAKFDGTDAVAAKYVSDGTVKECTAFNHLVPGASYVITYVGDSVFTDVGASDNKVGVVFTATGAGRDTADTGAALLLGMDNDTDADNYLARTDGGTSGDYLKYLRAGVQKEKEGSIDIVDINGNIVYLDAAGNGTSNSMTDGIANTKKKSRMYPIQEFIASSHGAWGNDVGIRLFADNANVFDKDILQGKNYTYSFGIVRRENKYKSGKLIENRNLEQKWQFSYNPDAVSALTGNSLYFSDLYLKRYQNLDPTYGDTLYADFDQVHVYSDKISDLLHKFAKKEYEWMSTNADTDIRSEMALMDFGDDTDADGKYLERYAFNFIGGQRFDGAPYHTYIFEDAKEVPLLNTTTVWAESGSDGTMSLSAFDKAVGAELELYADPEHELQDIAYHVESIFYDSGFSMKTKQSIINFITHRRDTCIALSSYSAVDVGKNDTYYEKSVDNISNEDMNWAIYLKAAMQNTKESDYFGTPCARGVMLAGHGIPKAGRYKVPTPITAELAIKAARYMGQPKWVNEYRFDEGTYKKFELLDNVNLYWVSPKARNLKWAMGINYALRFDRESLFFPCVKTIYEDDTSVLNSFITVMAICHLNKVDNKIWREFTGTSGMSDAVLKDRVNASVRAQTQGVFDDRFVIIPRCQVTAADNERGYSWTLPVEIYAYNMKTAMTTWIESYRMSDLGA